MTEYLQRNGRPDLAYHHTSSPDDNTPEVVFMPGFRSDMEGTKALYLEKYCKDKGLGYLRFDYSGHGLSEGLFEDGCISDWLEDTLDILDKLPQSRKIYLVGSSMGGWLALLAALKRPEIIAGVIGIAAAPDFTRDILAAASADQKKELGSKGYIEEPTPYSPTPQRFTKKLLDDGEKHCLLDGGIDLKCPVTLLQGMEDSDVKWQKAVRIGALLTAGPKKIRLVESADHRFSRSSDLELLADSVEELALGGPSGKAGAFVACEVVLEGNG